MSKPRLSQKGESGVWKYIPQRVQIRFPKFDIDLAVIVHYGNIQLLRLYDNFMSHLIAGSFIENVYGSSQKINAGRGHPLLNGESTIQKISSRKSNGPREQPCNSFRVRNRNKANPKKRVAKEDIPYQQQRLHDNTTGVLFLGLGRVRLGTPESTESVIPGYRTSYSGPTGRHSSERASQSSRHAPVRSQSNIVSATFRVDQTQAIRTVLCSTIFVSSSSCWIFIMLSA